MNNIKLGSALSTTPTTNGATAAFTALIYITDILTVSGKILINFPKWNLYYSTLYLSQADLGVGSSPTAMIPSSTTASAVTVFYAVVSKIIYNFIS